MHILDNVSSQQQGVKYPSLACIWLNQCVIAPINTYDFYMIQISIYKLCRFCVMTGKTQYVCYQLNLKYSYTCIYRLLSG